MVVPQSTLARSKGQSALDLGSKLYRKGSYRESAIAFKEATKLDPALIKAWENLGWAFDKSGQTKEALRIFETILKIEPGNLEVQNAVGFLFIEKNQWHRAIPHLTASLKLNENQNLVSLHLGKAYQKTGQWDRSIKLFKHALKIQPDNWKALQHLAFAYETSGQRALAISTYENYLYQVSSVSPEAEENEIAKKLSVLYARQGDELYRKNRFQKAEEAYEQALDWNPNNLTLLRNLGWSLEKQGKYNEAINQWKKVVIDGHAPLAHQIANAYFNSGQINVAQEWYRETARQDPALQSVQFRLFEYALKKNKNPDALNALRHVFAVQGADKDWSMMAGNHFIRNASFDQGLEFFLERLPHSSYPETTKKVLGRLYAKMGSRDREVGNVSQAILNYEKALLMDGFNAPAYRDLGWLYWHAGKQEKSERVWRQYQKNFLDKAEPYDLLARNYLNQGRYKKSLVALKESLTIDPDRPVQKLLQAKALYWDKRYQEAMQSVDRLVREYPDFLPIQYFYGEVLMRQQDFRKGKTQWRKVLDMGEKNPRAYYYWVQSLYETGEYETAVEEAKKFLNQHAPYKPIIKLLVNDAFYREDKEQAIFWYENLLKNFGDHPGDWLELAKLYQKVNHSAQAMNRLKQAEKKFPDDVEVRVALGDLNLKEGKYEEALGVYRNISEMNPDNRRAFIGTFHALRAVGRLEEAIRHLQSNQKMFLKDYEINLALGDISVAMKDPVSARSFYSQVAKPRERGQYVPILLYHGLSGHSRTHNLSAQRFDDQLKGLADAGYTTLTVSELGDILSEKRSLPEKPILITFDDARRDAFHFGDPVLKKYGMKATMFLPTARMHDEDPFFADWKRTRKYSESGSWDLQAHGHKAHDLVSIDSKGAKGNFLTNRIWLNEKDRQETVNDFYARLDGDYQTNIKHLKTQIPGLNVVGYAYPFSEAGQSRSGNVESARAINQTLLRKYFKFGFIQDQTGYNWMEPGDTKTSLLRRFSVPRNWDGDRLVQHLSENHPSNMARLALAKSLYWNGKYSEAGKMFSNLAVQEPRLKNKVQIYLADISYQGGNYWESKKILEGISDEESIVNPKVQKLKEAVALRKRPRILGIFDFFNDSNDRTNHSESARIYFPLEIPLELMLEGGNLNFKEKGRQDIDGGQVAAGFKWMGWKSLQVEGRFRNRTLSKRKDTQNYWGSAKYRKNNHTFQFNASKRDIDTVRAIDNGIRVNTFSQGYQTRISKALLGRMGVSYQNYNDGNSGFDFRSSLRYRLPDWKNWSVGADLSFRDSDFEAREYYTPDSLLIGLARVLYQQPFGEDFDFRADFGLGGADDKVNGLRWVTSGGVKLDYSLTRQFKAGLSAKYSVVPGYESVNLQAVMDYRF